ncbi:propanediol dehydratase small subunit [Salmonella enterica subsp. enterica]|nr:propanediol dehydratase small subunit [Salmonella enterica subsp. enterica]
MNTDAIESMVRDVLSRMNSLQGDAPAAAPAAGGTSRSAKVSDYPLANKHPEWVKTATNKTLDDFTLENVLSNKVTAQDMRITPETLRLQASIAKDAGRDRLAMNFERAAELTAVPDDRILESTTPFVRIVQRKKSCSLSPTISKTVIRQRFAQLSFVKRQGCTLSVKNSKATISFL